MSRVTRTGSAGAESRDRHQEPVAAPRQRFDEPRGVRGIAQHLTDLADAEVQSLLEVHERVAAPHVIADLVARHDFAAATGEELEHLERLRSQLDQVAALAELAGRRVQLEPAKAQDATGHSSKTHRELSPRQWKGVTGAPHYSARV